MKKSIYISFLATSLFFSCGTSRINTFEDLVYQRKDGICYLKKGSFYPMKTIEIPSNSEIIGNQTSIFFDEQSQFPIFRANSTARISIANVAFAGKQLVNTSDKSTLGKYNDHFIFEIHNSSHIQLENCRFSNSYGTAVHLSDCSQVAFRNSSFSNIGISTIGDGMYSYDGIFIGTYKKSEKVSISNCDFNNIGTLFPSDVPSWPNDGDGIHIQGVGEIDDVEITNNRFYKCAARGVKIQSGSNINIQNNQFTNCWTAVNMAMAKDINHVSIAKNMLKSCRLSFGTDCLANEKKTVSNLNIRENTVDTCLHFFRTSGPSSVINSNISNNKIDKIGTYFFTGRLINSIIENNSVLQYATSNDPSDNMIIYVSPESDNLTIRNNVFGKSPYSRREIENFSKNKVLIENNRFISIQTVKN